MVAIPMRIRRPGLPMREHQDKDGRGEIQGMVDFATGFQDRAARSLSAARPR